jgi:hypothetical protein
MSEILKIAVRKYYVGFYNSPDLSRSLFAAVLLRKNYVRIALKGIEREELTAFQTVDRNLVTEAILSTQPLAIIYKGGDPDELIRLVKLFEISLDRNS